MTGPGVYARNATAMWTSLAPWTRLMPATPPGLSAFEIPAQDAIRAIVRQPPKDAPELFAALLAERAEHRRLVVEDPFGALQFPASADISVLRLPVMYRAPAPVTPLTSQPGTEIAPVTDRGTLATAEQVIVDGYPQSPLQPYRPERLLPPLLLNVPGWQVWLVRCRAEPAAACCTYDNGAVIGVYWLATMPEYRSRGLGRAVLTTALAARPGRPATLIATVAGERLYSSLGFQTVATAGWIRWAAAR
jgi:GNAT superfamily N-acetyltransferase